MFLQFAACNKFRTIHRVRLASDWWTPLLHLYASQDTSHFPGNTPLSVLFLLLSAAIKTEHDSSFVSVMKI
jgi:hypothetical protein